MKRNSSQVTRKKKGFTLVELVVVIAVLAILAGVGVVAYNGYITYAQKNNDRVLVGEILHAFDLANYSNPDLFAEGETAHFYFTNNGATVIKASKNDELKESLEDALGDLGSLKLSYSGWNSADMSKISSYLTGIQSKINDSNSYLYKYLDKTENPGAASFAGNMSELWSVVEDKIDAFSQGENKNYLKQVVDYSTDTRYTDKILNAWTKTGADGAMPQDEDNSQNKVPHAANLARNYAFAIFVENKYSSQLTPEMEKTLDGIKQTNGTTNVQSYFWACTGSEWEAIITDYTTNQARADALAYLALMEAGKTVIPTAPNADVSDDALRETLSSVVGGVSALLDKSTDFETYQSLVTKLSDAGGSTVTFSMKKVNGVMVPTDFSDPDLNPRASSSGSTPDTCSREDHTPAEITLSFRDSGNNTNYITDDTIVLCTKNADYNSCTVTFAGAGALSTNNVSLLNGAEITYSNNLVTFDPQTKQITAIGSGSDVITIKFTASAGSLSVEQTYTINVTVH